MPALADRSAAMWMPPLSTGWVPRISMREFIGLGLNRRGSRIADRGSRIADRGSRIADRGSRIADRGSRIADRGSRIADEGVCGELQSRKDTERWLVRGLQGCQGSERA